MKNRTMGWLPLLLLASVGCNGKLDVGGADSEGAGATGGSGGGGQGSGGSSGTSEASSGSGGSSASVGGTLGTGGGFEGVEGSLGGGFYPPTVFELVQEQVPEKVDLLFVVDNSIGTGEKQALLQQAIPRLFDQLVSPGDYGHDFAPVSDLHVGIITTSLGSFGGQICSPNGPEAPDIYSSTEDDRGHLLPSVRPDDVLESYNGLGFLAWDPNGNYPGGEGNFDTLVANFQDQLAAVGQEGCGYEAPLESWYRFLVDPTPALETVVENDVSGPRLADDGTVLVDEELLAQRQAFLRPDSAVQIVMVTDEDDCSILDRGRGYLSATAVADDRQFIFPEAATACDTDPNDPCCRSCGLPEDSPPDGCEPLADDPKCQAGRDYETDMLNLRCYDQKRRFGMDLLQPLSRYVDALTKPQVLDTAHCTATDNGEDCPWVDNPLFARDARGIMRKPGLVHLAGIVGVPWQDIATDASLDGSGLTFKTAKRLAQDGVWDLILGDPATNTPPEDPLMFETPLVRTGTQPVTGEPLGAVDSQDPQENSINGHEYDNSTIDDLQYSCIFPLETPRDCSTGEGACDCTEGDLAKNRPLCNPPGGGPAGTTQYYDKAYPGLRQLQVLRDLGDNAAVASICPKDGASSASSGYNPGMDAVVASLGRSLGPQCLDHELPVDAAGQAICTLVEVSNNLDCESAGHEQAATSDADTVRRDLDALGVCSGSGCDDWAVCEVQQLDGADGEVCQQEVDPGSLAGFCYIDPGQDVGNADLVSSCPSGQKRLLRILGDSPSNSIYMLHYD